MKRLARLAAAAMLCALVGCSDEPSKPNPATGSIAGTITAVDTGRPVIGTAIVVVDPRTLATRSALVRTDALGRFAVSSLAPGKYAVFIYHEDLVVFDRTSDGVQVEAGKTARFDMRLLEWRRRHASLRIAGVVRDADTHAPVPGAYVGGSDGLETTWAFAGITFPRWTVTNASGAFEVGASIAVDADGNEIGLVPIGVTKSGYAPAYLVGGTNAPDETPFLPMPAEGDSVLHVVVDLHELPAGGMPPESSGAIKGRVFHIDRPVANVGVAANLFWKSNPDTLRHGGRSPAVLVPDGVAFTDSLGGFVIAGLVPGGYYLTAAYLPDDGYSVFYDWGDVGGIAVAARDTSDAGDIQAWSAMNPVTPADRAEITDATPLLTWTVPEFPAGYVLAWYEISFSEDFAGRAPVIVTGASWQVPDSLAIPHGGHALWAVAAWARGPHGAREVRLASFERNATFTVR